MQNPNPQIFQYPCSDSTKCHPTTVNLRPGRYLIECYGAQGGKGNIEALTYPGGKGAYASGILNLQKATTFYLYIGGKGQDGVREAGSNAKGGWNGGGDSGVNTYTYALAAGAGGGCTDVRLIKAPSSTADTANDEESSNTASLNSRIIVAAGGSGAAYYAYGAPGGDLNAYKVTGMQSEQYATGTLSTQKGKGENGKQGTSVPSSGSGAGYYGGKAADGIADAQNTPSYQGVSSSGSSYVAGYPKCPSLPTTEPYSVFGSRLINPNIANGISFFPSVSGTETEKGHSGNGAVKITQLEAFIPTASPKRTSIPPRTWNPPRTDFPLRTDFPTPTECPMCTCNRCFSAGRNNIILFCVVFIVSNNINNKIKSE